MKAEDIVMDTGIAAFARGSAGTITAWNTATEAMLGLPASKVVGRPCHLVVDGHDELGTYCCERCPSWRAAISGRPIDSYQMQVRNGLGRRIGVTVTILVTAGKDGLSLIHLVEPVDEPGAVVSLWEDTQDTDPDMEALSQTCSSDLTFLELDIMHELAVGHDCVAIADRLVVSEARAWQQISSCVRKLRTRTRTV